MSWLARDTARLTAAFRRAVLRLFVRLWLFDEDQAAGMPTWPHSGFHVHTAVWVPEDDRAFATWLARYCARNPVALERLSYDRAAKVVPCRSDKSEGPTSGTETADQMEFLARVLTHVPDKGQVTTRYYDGYASRPRGIRRKEEAAAADAPAPIVTAPRLGRVPRLDEEGGESVAGRELGRRLERLGAGGRLHDPVVGPMVLLEGAFDGAERRGVVVHRPDHRLGHVRRLGAAGGAGQADPARVSGRAKGRAAEAASVNARVPSVGGLAAPSRRARLR